MPARAPRPPATPNRQLPRAVREDSRSQREAVEPANEPLDFDRDSQLPGRIGDPEHPQRTDERFPPERVRRAGQPAVGDRAPGADDLSPETLLGEDAGAIPEYGFAEIAADTELREIAAEEAGLGDGPDEAELAETNPVGRSESRARQRKAAEHAADPNFFEPSEAAMRREAGLDRRKRR